MSENNPFREDLREDSYEGEAAVLASMILEPACIGTLAASLSPDTFRRPENRIIYEAIGETYLDHGNTLDIILLRDTLKKKGQLEVVGGVDYLIEIVESTPSAANVKHYTRVVKDAYHERQLQQAIAEIGDIASDLKPLPERIREIQEKAMSLELGDDTSSDLVDFGKHIGSVVDNIRDEDDFIKTGIQPIDDRILGFLPSEFIVLAARPRQGKSAMASQWAVAMAKAGAGVLFVSLEMSPQSLMERILSSESSVDLHEYGRWRSDADTESMRLMGNELAKARLNLTFAGHAKGSTPSELAVMVKRLKRTRGLKCVFVDYLQLMSSGKRAANLRETITAISRQLKLLAIAEDVVVVALSQLNREVEGRTDHVPRLSDLRESGSIEQDADLVMLLNRPELYGGDADGKANLYIAKSRRGPGGVIELDFAARYTRFGAIA